MVVELWVHHLLLRPHFKVGRGTCSTAALLLLLRLPADKMLMCLLLFPHDLICLPPGSGHHPPPRSHAQPAGAGCVEAGGRAIWAPQHESAVAERFGVLSRVDGAGRAPVPFLVQALPWGQPQGARMLPILDPVRLDVMRDESGTEGCGCLHGLHAESARKEGGGSSLAAGWAPASGGRGRVSSARHLAAAAGGRAACHPASEKLGTVLLFRALASRVMHHHTVGMLTRRAHPHRLQGESPANKTLLLDELGRIG